MLGLARKAHQLAWNRTYGKETTGLDIKPLQDGALPLLRDKCSHETPCSNEYYRIIDSIGVTLACSCPGKRAPFEHARHEYCDGDVRQPGPCPFHVGKNYYHSFTERLFDILPRKVRTC